MIGKENSNFSFRISWHLYAHKCSNQFVSYIQLKLLFLSIETTVGQTLTFTIVFYIGCLAPTYLCILNTIGENGKNTQMDQGLGQSPLSVAPSRPIGVHRHHHAQSEEEDAGAPATASSTRLCQTPPHSTPAGRPPAGRSAPPSLPPRRPPTGPQGPRRAAAPGPGAGAGAPPKPKLPIIKAPLSRK